MSTLRRTTFSVDYISAVPPATIVYLIQEKEIFFAGIDDTILSTVQFVELVIEAICKAESIHAEEYLFYDVQTSVHKGPFYHARGYFCIDRITFGGERGVAWGCVATNVSTFAIEWGLWTPRVPIAVQAFQHYIGIDPDEVARCARRSESETQAETARREAETRRELLQKHGLVEHEAIRYSNAFMHACDTYGIPHTLWNTPGLYEYMDAYAKLQEFQHKLGHPLPEWTHVMRGGTRDMSSMAECFLRCAVAALQDGLLASDSTRDYIRKKAAGALSGYNLAVVTQEEYLLLQNLYEI